MTDLEMHAHRSRADEPLDAWAARQNLANQDRFFRSLCQIVEDGPVSLSDVAEALGLPEEDTAAILRGEVDLTMHEIRLLSAGMSVVVDYRAMPAERARWAQQLARRVERTRHPHGRLSRKPDPNGDERDFPRALEHVWRGR